MVYILTGILSLIQYKNEVEDNFSDKYRVKYCEYCGKQRPQRHGIYTRQSAGNRNACDKTLNPIKIYRYYCSSCRHTTSALPECLAKNRWYLWSVQEIVLLLFIQGKNIHKIAQMHHPSRHTISRWISRFKEQFFLHKDTLVEKNTLLAPSTLFNDFWGNCLNLMNLSKAMRLCHASGVIVP